MQPSQLDQDEGSPQETSVLGYTDDRFDVWLSVELMGAVIAVYILMATVLL